MLIVIYEKFFAVVNINLLYLLAHVFITKVIKKYFQANFEVTREYFSGKYCYTIYIALLSRTQRFST